jgi:isoquinoline 1-oxidoreductase subunit beta
VTGAARYGIDVQVPGMVYAAVLQSPYEGGTPATIDDSAARAVPGITNVIRLPAGVGVVGNSVAATQAAKNQLVVTWTSAPAASHDSERALEEFAAIARDKSRAGVKFAGVGDTPAAMSGAARIFRGEYRTRYTYHAQMEPMNATAAVTPDGKSAEIWAGIQNVSGLFNDVAKLLQTERSRITFHQHVIGGGYGRRGGPQDVVLDAVRLAKAVGSPVKVIWSREDDMATGKFRPMTAHHMEAGFDAGGKLVAWHHRVVAESVAGYRAGLAGTAAPAIDGIVMKGSSLPQYPIPNKLVEHIVEVRGARLASTIMRSRSRAFSTR